MHKFINIQNLKKYTNQHELIGNEHCFILGDLFQDAYISLNNTNLKGVNKNAKFF